VANSHSNIDEQPDASFTFCWKANTPSDPLLERLSAAAMTMAMFGCNERQLFKA
jgi:hypothetical protein